MIGQGDGYKYRGKGLIHLTFKEHYERASIYAKKQGWIDTDNYFVNNPDSITNNGKYALLSVVWFWNSQINKSKNVNFKNKYCYEIADIKAGTDNERVNAITYIVNQRTDSYEKRIKAYNRLKNHNIFKDFT
ncbi:hypothetical protein B9T66_07640 [Helicobacter sp. TUL]|uniref:hypothetical protein n=1 Tax=Helicobacter sp. TUL TaxID=1848928 RepID=UPI000BD5BC2D|nr:hypothetical protein [Helicobacter sp. TUL]PAU99408.1 hypothetical protein B9T66_07640 [Helicobacter sp. TUL]